MTERPIVTDAAEDVYSSLVAFHKGDSTDYELLSFVEALVGPTFDPLWSVLQEDDDGRPAWGRILNADLTPEFALQYLGQFAGVVLEPSMSVAEKRTALKTPSGFRRGTPAAMIAAGQRYLTGSKQVALLEMDSSAYHFSIRTITSETPDEDQVEAAFLAQKPAGLVMDYAAIDGQTYAQLDIAYANYAAVDAAYANYEELRTDTP